MSPRHAPDTVLHGGVVHTMDDQGTTASAVAIEGGRITAVGGSELVSAADTHTAVVDLHGQTVVPGLIDVHTHIELATYSRHLWTDVRGLSPDAVLDEVRSQAAAANDGDWVVLQGTFGQALPDKGHLDDAAPDNPVAVRWSMHKFQLNSCALASAGIDGGFVAPPGMRVHVDGGRPTGLVEEGWDLLNWRPPLADALAPLLEESVRNLYMRHGVTTIAEIGASAAGVAALRSLTASSPGFARVGVALTAAPGHQPMADVEKLARTGLGAGLGDDRFTLEAIKIFLDGGRDGAFRSTGLDAPAQRWGLLTRVPQALAVEVATAVDGGLPVWMHAIGDLSQEMAVAAIEEVGRRHPGVDHRCRIEHFGNELYAPATLDRLVAAGGLPAPNPAFIHAEPTDPARRLPPGVVKYGIRALHEAGVRPPGNSDTAGAQPFACNPWFVMQCMVGRQNKEGVLVDPDQAVSRRDALAAFTRDAARALSRRDERGVLAPGRFADLAVLDRDPLADTDESLTDVGTRLSLVGGEVGFCHPDASEELRGLDRRSPRLERAVHD